jgi:hypothetical protein
MYKYRVNFPNGAYEEFLDQTEAIDYQASLEETTTLEQILLPEEQESIEDVLANIYRNANWQSYLDKLESANISEYLFTHPVATVQAAAWNVYNVILQLLDWPIKVRPLVNEYRTFCFLTNQLVPLLPPALKTRYLEILTETNVVVLGLEEALQG